MKRILILSANPKNTGRLRLDEEMRVIQTALEQSPLPQPFEVMLRPAVRVNDLQSVLSADKPHIVHFCGHGADTQGLALENELGQLQLVSTQALANLFQLFQTDVECVFLNACYSATQAEAIHQHIDCVVGMNQAVGDKAAIAFAQGFYRAIATDAAYDRAFALGCNAIDLQGIPESLTPVLKYRPRARNPLPVEAPVAPKTSEERMPTQPDRSVSIGGNVVGSAVQTGDQNTASIQFQQTTLPPADRVDMRAELSALRAVLVQLETLDRRKIENALTDAEEELKKPQPNKDEVGQALERALNYAQKTAGFASAIDKLQPPVTKVAAWLGENWYKLLGIVRLGVGI